MPKVVPPKKMPVSCIAEVTEEQGEAGPPKAKKTTVLEVIRDEGVAEKTYPHEWHAQRRVRMKDIPTNIVLHRRDKQTYYISSSLDVRMMFSHLIAVRRKAIITYMDTASLDAADGIQCYVPHEFQSPIRHALDDWYVANVCSAADSGWQKYIEHGCPGDLGYAKRSHFKTWAHKTSGSPFIYDFFVAFGTIKESMVKAVNHACRQRALTTAEPAFAPTAPTPQLQPRREIPLT